MENNTKLGAGTYYDLNDKPFWAAFLNLARHNAFITINHINQQLSLKPIDNDQDILVIKNIWKSNEISKNIEKKAKLLNLIKKHFPFLEPASYGQQSFEVSKGLEKIDKGKKEKKKEDKLTEQSEAIDLDNLLNLFFTLLEKLRDFRNYYSHFKHSKQLTRPTFESGLLFRLYDILDANVRMVKQDHKHNLEVDAHNDFEHLIRKAKLGDNPKFKAHFFVNDVISEAGLLFFTSLFLDKKDAIWMQKKIYGFKGGDESFKKMTNEVFCRNRILLPKLRLESTYSESQMLLDMLSELSRCPKSLFERLKEEDREKFKVPIEILNDEDYESQQEDPFKNILVRHQNRFPYFALRYFDLKEVFANLRFQLDLGNYHFSIYDKVIGEQNEKRHLTRNLYGFGRIQELNEANQPEEWKRLVKDLDCFESSDLPFVSKTTPHYHFMGNKIGIKFVYDKRKKWPGLEVENISGTKTKYNYDKHFVADCFLSVHELVPMMLYYLITNDGSKVENIIKNTKDSHFKIYDEFKDGQINDLTTLEKRLSENKLLIGHLPKQLLSVVKKTQKNMEADAERKISELIADTQKRQKQLDEQTKQKIRIGKRRSGLMKSGIIADWLVRDIMRFQPVATDENNRPLNRSKANSTEYQLLQRTFALFGGEKDRLSAYFKQMNLIDSDNPHPFIFSFDWNAQPNILSFYENYLNARLKYLKSISPQKWLVHQYFLMLKVPKSNKNTLVEGWKTYFNLPRGLFTQAIKDWFAENETSLSQSIEQFERAGFIIKAIPLYFKEKFNDDLPKYYQYDYNVANPLKPEKAEFISIANRKKYLSENKLIFTQESFNNLKEKASKSFEKKFLNFKDLQKFEREMRLVKSQDMLKWLMCRNLQTDSQMNLIIGDLYLKNIDTDVHSDASLNILNRVMPMKLPVNIFSTDDKGNVLKQNGAITTVYIEEKQTKVLKQGNFKALVKDRRLNCLFSFVETENMDLEKFPISKLRLESELAKYQISRIEVFKISMEIEEAIITKHPQLNSDNFRIMVEEWLKQKVNEAELEQYAKSLIAIRNAFAHNQYPMYNKENFSNIKKFNPQNPNSDEKEGLSIAVQLTGLAHKLKEIINKNL